MFAIGFGANHFAPLLPVYRAELSLTQSKVTLLLAIYILGLVPALVLGGTRSDYLGRRAVMRPAAVISLFGTLLLMFFPERFEIVVAAGRLVTGIAVGLMLAAGAAWLKELTAANGGSIALGAKRATVATSAGFGLGPAVSGAMAQWLPAPLYTPLAAHLLLIIVSGMAVWNVPETAPPCEVSPRGWSLPSFRILLWAPWVFGAATTAFATLPTFLSTEADIAFAGLIASMTMLSGVAVQQAVNRRILNTGRAPVGVGLFLAAVGMVLGAWIAHSHSVFAMLLTAPVLGAAYGTLMVSGLFLVQNAAHKDDLGQHTAIYYSATYLGFFAPWILSLLSQVIDQEWSLLFGAFVAVATATVARR
ncbi:MFS transporter [Corynebacterium gerontici]|uniref:Major Facilitator Superfamily protein n=2 Tax=Corynebacterium gerontici TaxID=2079234 RepID=A0A3G6J4F8_9CORY|nr:MFS transporter [Corynebacterium gerontici]AZA10954.1 Major Facilitator Superfamily protein [Corynebacterium gerontici]